MRRLAQHACALIAVVALFAGTMVGPASAATSPVITDCVAHAALTKGYSIAQLHHALATLSASTREYTDCADVINRALAAALSKPGTGPGAGTGAGGSGSFLPTPVLIILVLLMLVAVSFGAVAIRRRRAGDG